MKKILIAILLILSTMLLVSCNIPGPIDTTPPTPDNVDVEFEERNNMRYPNETEPNVPVATTAKDGIKFNKFRFVHVDGIGDMYLMRVAPDTDVFKFYEFVESKSSTKWYLCKDISGTEVIPSKTISLVPGNNIYYVMTEKDSDIVAMHIVNIYKNSTYDVCFENSQAVKVEEGFKVSSDDVADGVKNGYIFKGWNFDFEQPIYNNINVPAIWEIDPEYVPENSLPIIELIYDGQNNSTSEEYNIWFDVISSEVFGIINFEVSKGAIYKYHTSTGLISSEPIVSIMANETDEYKVVVKLDKESEQIAIKLFATFRNNETEINTTLYFLINGEMVEAIEEDVYLKIINGELIIE